MQRTVGPRRVTNPTDKCRLEHVPIVVNAYRDIAHMYIQASERISSQNISVCLIEIDREHVGAGVFTRKEVQRIKTKVFVESRKRRLSVEEEVGCASLDRDRQFRLPGGDADPLAMFQISSPPSA